MSKVDLNALVNGFSGKLGNAVLRRRGSRTYIIQRPKERDGSLSEKQLAHQERFKRAVAYAKSKMANADGRAEYEALAKSKEFATAFNLAVKDYLSMPGIHAVKADKYTGKVNDTIVVKAADDFKVIEVKVAITTAANTLVESGNAVYDPFTLEWYYIAKVENNAVAGSTIRATVIDRAGNETTQAVVIS